MHSRSRYVVIAGALYAAAIAAAGLWPTHVDQDIDLTGWAPLLSTVDRLALTDTKGYVIVELAANVLLFPPLAMLVCALWPRLRWIPVTVVGSLTVRADRDPAGEHAARPHAEPLRHRGQHPRHGGRRHDRGGLRHRASAARREQQGS